MFNWDNVPCNDYLNFGTIQIPTRIYSEPEVYKGDEVIFVLKGKLTVQADDKETNDPFNLLV